MKRPLSTWDFRFMALLFKLRDLFISPGDRLIDTGLGPGIHVLDYGCGSGSFSIAAAVLVGPEGVVYAVDIHPLAMRMVQRASSRRGLTNIRTIQTERDTGLESQSVDAALLYDTFHGLTDPDGVLVEIHRVLKPNGILSFSDHHMGEGQIVTGVTGKGLFRLHRRGRRSYIFLKRG